MVRSILFIPKSKAKSWKIVWEKLIEWDHFLANENRINRFGQTRSSEGRRDQLGGSVQEANAEIQPGGHFIRIDRPGDIDRIIINILVGFSKIAIKKLSSYSSGAGSSDCVGCGLHERWV